MHFYWSSWTNSITKVTFHGLNSLGPSFMPTNKHHLKQEALWVLFGGKRLLVSLETFRQLPAASQIEVKLSFSSHRFGQVRIKALKDLYAQLYSFTKKPKCSVQYFIEHDESRLFSLPISHQAAEQLEENENRIQESDLTEEQNDIWSYCWGSSKFSSRKAYNIMQGHTKASPLFSWLWASTIWESSSFSSGYSLETGWMLEIYWGRKTCTLMNIAVFYAIQDMKKQASISFSDVPSVHLAVEHHSN